MNDQKYHQLLKVGKFLIFKFVALIDLFENNIFLEEGEIDLLVGSHSCLLNILLIIYFDFPSLREGRSFSLLSVYSYCILISLKSLSS